MNHKITYCRGFRNVRCPVVVWPRCNVAMEKLMAAKGHTNCTFHVILVQSHSGRLSGGADKVEGYYHSSPRSARFGVCRGVKHKQTSLQLSSTQSQFLFAVSLYHNS